MAGNIALIIKLLFISNSKRYMGGKTSHLINYMYSPHQFSSGAPCDYRQNLFRSLSNFPDLDPNSDMALCNLIKMSPILFIFHKD